MYSEKFLKALLFIWLVLIVYKSRVFANGFRSEAPLLNPGREPSYVSMIMRSPFILCRQFMPHKTLTLGCRIRKMKGSFHDVSILFFDVPEWQKILMFVPCINISICEDAPHLCQNRLCIIQFVVGHVIMDSNIYTQNAFFLYFLGFVPQHVIIGTFYGITVQYFVFLLFSSHQLMLMTYLGSRSS